MTGRHLKRFRSIDREYLYTDKHIHSSWSDGEDDILSIVAKARVLGLKHIAITDHIRSSSTYFDSYFDAIKKSRIGSEMDILVGFEAKIENFFGGVDFSDDVGKRADIRIASVHRFPIGNKLYEPGMFVKKACQEIELELAVSAVKGKKFDVLGHAGGMSLKTYNDFRSDYFEEIISQCKENDIAFELNSSHHLPVLDELLPLLYKYDPLVSFGSDAHKLDEIGNLVNILDNKLYG